MTLPSKLSALFDQYSFLQQNTPNTSLLPSQMDLNGLISHFEQAAFLPRALYAPWSSSFPYLSVVRHLRARLTLGNVISYNHASKQASYQVVQFPRVLSAEVLTGPRQICNALEAQQTPLEMPLDGISLLMASGEHPASFHAIFLTQMRYQQALVIRRMEWRYKTLAAVAKHCASVYEAREQGHWLSRTEDAHYLQRLPYGAQNQLGASAQFALLYQAQASYASQAARANQPLQASQLAQQTFQEYDTYNATQASIQDRSAPSLEDSSLFSAQNLKYLAPTASAAAISQLLQQTSKAIVDTLACSSIYSELVSSNSRYRQIAQRLLSQLKPTQKSMVLKDLNHSIQRRRLRGVLIEVFQYLPFSGTQQRFYTTLPSNRPAERAAILFALGALRAKERSVAVRVSEPGSANLLIKQFLQYSGRRAGVLISSASHVRSLDFPRNVRVFPYNKINMRNRLFNQHETFQFGIQNIRVNFFGEKKAEQNFELVDLDLVTVEFEQIVRGKRVDLCTVLKELNRQQFDFAIINRFDLFRAQHKLRYQSLFDVKSDFILNILGDNGPLRCFNAACLYSKFDQELLSQFQPEILQEEQNSDENLLKKLEKAAQASLEALILTGEQVYQEVKATIEKVEIDCGQKNDIESLREMRALFYDEPEESDIRTQITTQLNRMNTQAFENEEEADEAITDMMKIVRNNIINYHGQQQIAPDNVANCLKGDTTYPCAYAVLNWLDMVELSEKSGSKIDGFVLPDIMNKTCFQWNWLNEMMAEQYLENPILMPLIRLAPKSQSVFEIPSYLVTSQQHSQSYDSYEGCLGHFGRSLGIYVRYDVLSRIGLKCVENRHSRMIYQYNNRVQLAKLKYSDALAAWRFAEEFLRRPLLQPDAVQSITHISALDGSDNASGISLVDEMPVFHSSEPTEVHFQLNPSFYWEFKFTNYFNLATPRDLQDDTYTFYFTLFDYNNQLESEFLELESSDFACYSFFSAPRIYPGVFARYLLKLVERDDGKRKYAIINDYDGSVGEQLQNYKSKVHVTRDLSENSFTDIIVLPGELQFYMVQNLLDAAGKIERIYEVKLRTYDLAQSKAVACCQIIFNSLEHQIKEKVNNYLKTQRSAQNLAKPIISAANCLETVDIREKAVSEDFFRYNFTQKCPTMAGRRFIENVYQQFKFYPNPIEYAFSYAEMLNSLYQQNNLACAMSFMYLSTENDKKARQQQTASALFSISAVERYFVSLQTKIRSQPFYLAVNTCNYPPYRSFHGTAFTRLRNALNPFAHNKLYSQVDVRRDNYYVLISVPVFIETAPFKRYLCPRCCIYNDLWSTCFHLIYQCARVSLPQSRCRAEGNFMFPDIYFYNSYMHLYRGTIQAIISADISTIILIMQITKQNKDYIQHTINEKLINMIFSQFAEPVSNTCNPVVLQTKLVVQSAFAQSARIMRSYPSTAGVHQKLTLRYIGLVYQFEMRALENLRNAKYLTHLQTGEAIYKAEQQKLANSPVAELLYPLLTHVTYFGKGQLKCDLLAVAELSQAPIRALQFYNSFAEFAKSMQGCIRSACDFNNCLELVTRNFDQSIVSQRGESVCPFMIQQVAIVGRRAEFDIL